MKRVRDWLTGPIPVSIVLALLIGAVFMLIAGANPLEGYAAMVKGSFGSGMGFSTTLQRAIPIIGMAIAIAIAFRAGIINLGTEGQMLIGALAGGFVALTMPGPGPLVFLVALLTAVVVGACWGLIAALFQTWLGVPILLTTLLLNYPARYFSSWAIRYQLKDPESELVASKQISESVQLPMLAPRESALGQALANSLGSSNPITQVLANVNWSLIIVAALVVAVVFINKRTKYGFESGVNGQNSAFARYTGVKPAPLTLRTMALSGGIAGGIGALIILGAPSTRLIEGQLLQTNYPWIALLVTLLALYRPGGIVIAGIFYAAIIVGAAAMGRDLGLSPQIASVIQAVVIILIAYRVAIPKRKKPGEDPERPVIPDPDPAPVTAAGPTPAADSLATPTTATTAPAAAEQKERA